MKKYLLIFTFLFLINIGSQLTGTPINYKTGYGFSYYPESIEPALQALTNMTEVEGLIDLASKNGKIGIAFRTSNGSFNAFWDGGKREIILNPKYTNTPEKAIHSVLFELHNAASNHHLQKIFQCARCRNISKYQFVEEVERIEHANALATTKILQAGVKQGILPRDSMWGVNPSFEDYFVVQQRAGHSQWIAKMYDQLGRG